MKKRLLILLSCLLIAMLTTVFAQDVRNEELATDDDDYQWEACMAHEILCQEFSGAETFVYPDNYAGEYIDDETLIILLTDFNEETIEFYKDILTDYMDYVDFAIEENSYNELCEEKDEVIAYLDEKYDVVESCVDVKNNEVLIRVSDLTASDCEELTKELKGNGFIARVESMSKITAETE